MKRLMTLLILGGLVLVATAGEQPVAAPEPAPVVSAEPDWQARAKAIWEAVEGKPASAEDVDVMLECYFLGVAQAGQEATPGQKAEVFVRQVQAQISQVTIVGAAKVGIETLRARNKPPEQ